MRPFTTHTGLVAPLNRANVDTDQIIPKQFLKSVTRKGLGKSAFFDWRYLDDGAPNPDFVLNRPQYQGASVLVSGENFGSGSSREHAPWALEEYGFRVFVAPSFADIFRNNCYQNGLLPVEVGTEHWRQVMERAEKGDGYKLTADLRECVLTDDYGLHAPFELDSFRRECLLNGLDDIGVTLKSLDKIDAYEKRTPVF